MLGRAERSERRKSPNRMEDYLCEPMNKSSDSIQQLEYCHEELRKGSEEVQNDPSEDLLYGDKFEEALVADGV